jgi:dUTP pyrophosphatase
MNLFNRKKKIKIKKLVGNAKLPSKAHDNDACFDMWAISKKETEDYIQYGTGIAMEIPDGWVGLIFPRSSVTKEDLMLKNSVGVIDAGFRGEISFRFSKVVNNTWKHSTRTRSTVGGSTKTIIDISTTDRPLKIYQTGDKIGQIMFIKLPKVTLEEVDELADSTRGEGGYGSSGKN